MLHNLVSDLAQYKSIGIFGFGKEGRSVYDFVKKHLPFVQIVIIDQNRPQIVDKDVIFYSGENYLEGLSSVELIIKSPGISLYNLGITYEKYNFTSTTELFIKHFRAQIIGVTGTKGKSTLVSLIYAMFQSAKRDVVLCGNIGTPAFDTLHSIHKQTRVVMELSSHQLLNIKYSPHIAILTNLFQDHLDYYRSLEEYYNAKFNILKYQTQDDIAIVNLEEPHTYFDPILFQTQEHYNVAQNSLKFPVAFNIKNGFIHKSSLQILEQLRLLEGVDEESYKESVSNFKTLPHRLEYVDTINGVDFVNDSISTIPEASMEAIKILKSVKTLILGGYDRGIEYEVLVDFLLQSDVENILLFSQTGKIVYEKCKRKKMKQNCIYLDSLEEVVQKAVEFGHERGSIVLFSPAASSFNEYKNFVERGERFKTLVRSYKD